MFEQSAEICDFVCTRRISEPVCNAMPILTLAHHKPNARADDTLGPGAVQKAYRAHS